MLQIIRGLEAVPADFGPCAVAIGNFDGVHRGHRRILRAAIGDAQSNGWKSVALTFDPHPATIVAPDRAPQLMTTFEQRCERFGELGLDAVVVMKFNPSVSAWSPEEFVQRALADRLGARLVVVGENFRFGRAGAGDIATLEVLGQKLGFQVEAAAPVEVHGRIVSSSRIRQAVMDGRMAEARRLLTRSFSIRGAVVSGRGIGSTQTVPTLNLDPETDLLPADGVYVTATQDCESSRSWPSVTNVGVRPTFGGGRRVVETHLLDPIEGDSPRRIEVCFHRRLREEREFGSSQELRTQILSDASRAEHYFHLLSALGAKQPRTI